MEELKNCPHCGSDYGYYRKVYIKGLSNFKYHFDGSDGDNTDLNSYLDYKEYKTCFCLKCDKKIKLLINRD